MKKSDKLLTGLFTIVLGVLFIVLKGEVVSIGMTIMGVALIISSILDLIRKQGSQSIIKLVIGAVVIVFGWTLVSAALYIMAAVLLINSVMQISTIAKMTKGFNLSYLQPIMSLIVAICLLFNQGGTISWVFVVSGVCLIIKGVIAFFDSMKKETEVID